MTVRLKSYLNVFFGEQPGAMGQDLIELPKSLQLLWGFFQTIQPLGIPSDLQEVIHVQVDQIRALVPGSSLLKTNTHLEKSINEIFELHTKTQSAISPLSLCNDCSAETMDRPSEAGNAVS